MLYTPVVKKGRSSKFLKPWTGPFVVIRKAQYPALNYLLREIATQQVRFAHRNRLKLIEPRVSQSLHPGYSLLEESPMIGHESIELDQNELANLEPREVVFDGDGEANNGELALLPDGAQHQEVPQVCAGELRAQSGGEV